MKAPLPVAYVLPIRWRHERQPDLGGYLRWLAPQVGKIIVVDASPEELYERHRVAWSPFATHLRPEPGFRFRNGKVAGILTGIRLARHEKVVLADDDVRYEREGLDRVARLLDRAEVVRPQNYFSPLPWHAVWDTGRTLINRAFGRDYPGTLGVRRSAILATGGYDGDVLFENLELMRTITAAGGTVASPLDLYVARRPPDTKHFLSQRVRQAYDDFAIPPKMALWLALGPAAAAGARISPLLPAAAAGATVAIAEFGRRRGGGRRVFPFRASLAAPLWLAERSVTAWLAVGSKLIFGGARYAGGTIARAGTPRRKLVRLHGGRRPPLHLKEVPWDEKKGSSLPSSMTRSSERS